MLRCSNSTLHPHVTSETGEMAVRHTWQHLQWHPQVVAMSRFPSGHQPHVQALRLQPFLPTAALCCRMNRTSIPQHGACPQPEPSATGCAGDEDFPEAATASHPTLVLAAELAHSAGSAQPGCSGTGAGRALPALPAERAVPAEGTLAAGPAGPAGPAGTWPLRPLWGRARRRGGLRRRRAVSSRAGQRGRGAPRHSWPQRGHAGMLPHSWDSPMDAAGKLRQPPLAAAKAGVVLC